MSTAGAGRGIHRFQGHQFTNHRFWSMKVFIPTAQTWDAPFLQCTVTTGLFIFSVPRLFDPFVVKGCKVRASRQTRVFNQSVKRTKTRMNTHVFLWAVHKSCSKQPLAVVDRSYEENLARQTRTSEAPIKHTRASSSDETPKVSINWAKARRTRPTLNGPALFNLVLFHQ